MKTSKTQRRAAVRGSGGVGFSTGLVESRRLAPALEPLTVVLRLVGLAVVVLGFPTNELFEPLRFAELPAPTATAALGDGAWRRARGGRCQAAGCRARLRRACYCRRVD